MRLLLGDNDHGYHELKGNDVKEMKNVLIGETFTVSPPFMGSTRLLPEVFDYQEEDICLMMDEETNENTALCHFKINT